MRIAGEVILGAILIFTVVLVGLFLRAGGGTKRLKTPFFTLDVIERDAEQIYKRLPSPDASPEDRQYGLLREYHSRSLAQSTQSFWFSLTAASIGFIVIISAVIMAGLAVRDAGGARGFQAARDLALPALQILSGLIIEAVSALFFVQSNKARALLSEFFDKLREDRKLEESLRLAEKMTESDLKSQLLLVLSLKFSGSVTDDLITLLVQEPRRVLGQETKNL